MKKIAIVGTAASWNQAPFGNDDFEIWALNDMFMIIPYGNRWFELHNKSVIDTYRTRGSDVNYLDWFKKATIPIYMQEKFEDIPFSIKYPKWEIEEFFNRIYFKSTVDFMIALAIYEGFKEIHVYGVDMAVGEEYSSQKPSCEYWLGRAEGMGIKIFLPNDSDLLKAYYVYGYDEEKSNDFKKKSNARIAELHSQAMDAEKHFYLLTGEKRAWEKILRETNY